MILRLMQFIKFVDQVGLRMVRFAKKISQKQISVMRIFVMLI